MAREVQVVSASLNVPPYRAASWSAAQYEEFVDGARYDGLEFHAVRSRFLAQLVLGNPAISQITSLHQSFRSERWWNIPDGLLRERNLAKLRAHGRNVASRGILPLTHRSFRYLEAIQDMKGQLLPIVLYPEGGADFRHLEGHFGPRLWQPTAEVLAEWGALKPGTGDTLSAMQSAMREHGLDGICVDTFHWGRKLGNSSLPDWRETLPILASRGLIHQLHFSPARTDLGGSADDLEKILDGQFHESTAGKMFDAVYGWHSSDVPLTVVTEIPHMALKELGIVNFRAAHRDVVDAIRG